MRAALGWFFVMLVAIAAAATAAGNLAPHLVAYFDARHNIDFRVGLQLPIRVVWGASNGWPLVTTVWTLAALLGVAGWQLGRAAARLGKAALWSVIGAQLILGLALSLFPVTFSGDPYAYVIWGRLFGVHGLNPYLSFARFNAAGDVTLARCLQFYGNPPPGDDYGPLWTLVAGGIAHLESASSLWLQVWTHRAVAVAAAVATSFGILRLIPKTVPRRTLRLSAFAFNPLAMYETAVGGHNDMIMVALAVWAFALVDEYPLFAGLLIGASASIKFVSLIAVPFVIFRAAKKGFSRGALALVITLIIMVLCFKPFWAGAATLYALAGHSGVLAMSPTWLVAYPFFEVGAGNHPAFGWMPELPLLGRPSWPRLFQLTFVVATLTILASSIISYARGRQRAAPWPPATALVWSSPVIHPWYVLWLSPAAARGDGWAPYAWWFAALVFLRYALDATSSTSEFAAPVWFLMMLTAIFLAAPVFIAYRSRRNEEAGRTAQRTGNSLS